MDSSKQVAHLSVPGLEVVQPGLESAYTESWHYNNHAGRKLFAGENPPAPVIAAPTICGLRKSVFWLAAALAMVVIIVAGVGAGLGVELSRARNGSQDGRQTSSTTSVSSPRETSNPTLVTSAASGSATATSTRGATTTLGTSSSSTPTPSSPCPSGNDTVVSVSLGSMQYRIQCNSDFGGSGKETLATMVLDSFDDCLALCNTMNYFQDRSDVGITYNVEGTGTQTPGTCWCLGGANKTVVENIGNDVAVPL